MTSERHSVSSPLILIIPAHQSYIEQVHTFSLRSSNESDNILSIPSQCIHQTSFYAAKTFHYFIILTNILLRFCFALADTGIHIIVSHLLCSGDRETEVSDSGFHWMWNPYSTWNFALVCLDW